MGIMPMKGLSISIISFRDKDYWMSQKDYIREALSMEKNQEKVYTNTKAGLFMMDTIKMTINKV